MNTVPATKKDVETAIDNAAEKLAGMIGEGFTQNDKRFNALETKVGKLENKTKRLKDAIAI